ncbi:hypothetical protein BGX27_008081 [Mortierella sp. AM989]|nr:hypothetical protein BGX27_008081 [Mortierella sp. AM989]
MSFDRRKDEDNQDHGGDYKGRINTFIATLMRYLYTGNYPTVKMAAQFVGRAQDIGLLDKRRGNGELSILIKYSSHHLLDSAVSQLSVEIKKIYRKGTLELYEKVAITCLVWLPFHTQVDLLREEDHPTPACADLQEVLSRLPSGPIVTKLLSPVGRLIAKDKRKGPWGYKDKTVMMSMQNIDHLSNIHQEDFDPSSHLGSGYALLGSIRTDGFRLQLIAFKLNESYTV